MTPFLGTFHGKKIKEEVYRPDWRTSERRTYTILLSNILSELLQEGEEGSISTLPLSYKKWIKNENELKVMVTNIMECIIHLDKIFTIKGKEISLALEPEPDCLLEITDEILSFFDQYIWRYGVQYLSNNQGITQTVAREIIDRHLGICFDTCHHAVQFENLNQSIQKITEHGIKISKIQLSAALHTRITDESLRALQSFCDDVYLHQTRILDSTGTITAFKDLTTDTLRRLLDFPDQKLRSHFHVPLFFKGVGGIESTATEIDATFANLLKKTVTRHLEIETYTFSVLPPNCTPNNVVESIIQEYKWVLEKLGIPLQQ